MNKQILNKGISTPIGILIIVLVAIIAGGGILAYQYWWTERIEEVITWESFDQEISFIKGQFKIQLEKPRSLELEEIRSFAEYFENENGGELIFTNENLTFYIGVPNFLLAPGGPEEFYAPCKSYCEKKGFPADTPENNQCIRENCLLGTQEDISKGVFYIGIHERNLKVKEELQNTISRIIDSIKIQEINDEIADWKIYKNEECGFEIKYPSDWEKSEQLLSTATRINFRTLNEETIVWVRVGTYYDQTKGRETTLNELISSIKKSYEVLKEEDVSIDNTPAKKLHLLWNETKVGDLIFLQREREKNIFEIGVENRNLKKQDEYSSVFKQILSTFRFLE